MPKGVVITYISCPISRNPRMRKEAKVVLL